MKLKEDCFALYKGKCKALNETQCSGCAFYKSAQRYEEDKKKYAQIKKGKENEQA